MGSHCLTQTRPVKVAKPSNEGLKANETPIYSEKGSGGEAPRHRSLHPFF
jgi:hypothetical protein